MQSRDFCYWLQGFFELAQPNDLTREQTVMVQNHLAMVFKHEIDPSHGSKEHQAELSKAHQGGDAIARGFAETMLKQATMGDVLKTMGETKINC